MAVSEGDAPIIRPAATVILWRDRPQGPEVLMGQRGAAAAFMPSKFVFPGGAVDPDDHADPLPLAPLCVARLHQAVGPGAPGAAALAGAALRELHEETGLALDPAAILRFVFRAVTPPGRTRRFDARFFLAPGSAVIGDDDDFGAAEDELSHLHWISLADVRRLDLPFITEVVLSEVGLILAGGDQPGVPFFDNTGHAPAFRRLV